MNPEVLSQINYLAMGAGFLFYFALGMVWFGPLFGKPWLAMTGIDPENPEMKKGMGRIFGLSIVSQLFVIFTLACVIQAAGGGFILAICIGGAVATAFVMAPVGVNYLFEHRPFKLWMINTGYHATGIMGAAAVMGLWR